MYIPLVHWFERLEVHTPGPEICSILRGTRCTLEYILSPCDLKSFESRSHDRGLKLCLEQSSGDSVSPQIDVLPRFLRYRPLNRDVRDLELSTRP